MLQCLQRVQKIMKLLLHLIVVEDETFSFQIESPQLGIIHVNWGDGKQNEYKGEKDDDMYYIEKNILMHKRGNTLLQSRTSTI